MQISLGIDPGYGEFKVAGENGLFHFRSMHGVYNRADVPQTFGGASQVHGLRLNANQHILFGAYGESLVGARDMRLMSSAARVQDPMFLYYFLMATVLALPDEGAYTVNPVIGLPVVDMQNVGQRLQIATLLKGEDYKTVGPVTHNVETSDGRRYQITFNRVRFMSQPEGTFWDTVLDEAGNVDAGLLATYQAEKIGVVDVGSGTTDFNTVTDLQPTLAQSGSVTGGMNRLRELLREGLMSAGYSQQLSDAALEAALQKGTLTLFGKPQDVRDIVDRAADALWVEIRSYLLALVGDAAEFTRILVTGGGGAYLFNHINDHFSQHDEVQLVHDPMFANARGFYKYAQYRA